MAATIWVDDRLTSPEVIDCVDDEPPIVQEKRIKHNGTDGHKLARDGQHRSVGARCPGC